MSTLDMARAERRGGAGRRLLIVNPNTSEEMTRSISMAAAEAVSPDVSFTVVNPQRGLPGIEGFYDGAIAASQVLKLVREGEAAGYDGFVIACFDDIALDAARSIATGPVIGTCQAGITACAAISSRFSIVTTVANATPVIRDLVGRYGMSSRCTVRAADIRVAESKSESSSDRIKLAVRKALEEDGAEAIVLGSASMSGRASLLSAEFDCPVVDGVAAAVGMADFLTRIRLNTSKLCAYRQPFEKPFVSAAEFTEV